MRPYTIQLNLAADALAPNVRPWVRAPCNAHIVVTVDDLQHLEAENLLGMLAVHRSLRRRGAATVRFDVIAPIANELLRRGMSFLVTPGGTSGPHQAA